MRSVLRSPTLYLGLLLGLTFALLTRPETSVTSPPSETATYAPDLNGFSEEQLTEYYELKSMKERYEKADELLGKFVLALIAGRLMDVSDQTRRRVENSAAGRAENLPAPAYEPAPAANVVANSRSAIPTPAPVPTLASGPATVPVPAPTAPPPTSSSRNDPDAPENPPTSFPFDAVAAYKSTMCRGERGWFVSDGWKSYFAAEPAGEGSNELVGTMVSASRQMGQLTLLHCAPPNFKNRRVRLTFMIKAEGVRRAKVVLRRWRRDGTEGSTNTLQDIEGTFDWRSESVTFFIQRDSLAVGFEMIGPGKIWIRDVKLMRAQSL